MKVLTIGAAVMDIVGRPVPPPELWKEKQRIGQIRLLPGGDAANQSIRLAALGIPTGICTCLGDDENGALLKSELANLKVDTSCLHIRENAPTGSAIVLVDERGSRHVFSAFGAHSTLCRQDLPALTDPDLKVVSLASLFGMDTLEQDGLKEYLKEARSRGILIAADLLSDKFGRGLKGLSHLLPLVDIFMPSHYEALALTGPMSVENCARALQAAGPETVIIKCGEKGVYLLNGDDGCHIPCPSVSCVDTTGAGDCFAAVLISRLLENESMRRACRNACVAASFSTLFFGASAEVFDRAQLQKILAAESAGIPLTKRLLA